MNCRTCDYPLWGLPGRICPECGDPYQPSEYEFAPNAVRYHCPHCRQEYYGTTAKGHLDPRTFQCVTCATAIDMDEMVLEPATGVSMSQTRAVTAPWLVRQERGLIRGWFATVGMALAQPARLMRGVPVTASNGAAFGFYIMSQLVTMFSVYLVSFLIFGLLFIPLAASNAGGGPGGASMLGVMLLTQGLALVGALVVQAVMLLVWWLAAHGLLRLFAQPAHGMSRTFQALCYASGANVVSAVPCIGPYLGWIWWLVSAVLTVREAQRVSGPRASVAVLTMPVVGLVLVVGLYILMIVLVVGGIQTAQTMPPAGTGGSAGTAQVMHADLEAYCDQHGQWPGVALELMTTGPSLPDIFLQSGSFQTPDDVVISGASSLAEFAQWSPEEQEALIAEKIDAMGDDVIAHRVGDFVFTYHGVDPYTGASNLWTCVLAPKTASAGAAVVWWVAELDGTVSAVPPGPGPFLDEQNTVRAAEGLPPLPDLDLVTEAQPARDE